jgi:hypothetical protein
VAYDPVSDRIIGWTTGRTIYSYDPDANAWTQHSASGADPGAPEGNGTYGRFRYCPNKNVFVVYNDVDKNVFIYRHTADTSAPQWYLDYLENASVTAGPERPGKTASVITASPNPFKSQAVISIGKKLQVTSCKLSIFDINGKKLETCNLQLSTCNSFSWNASGLPAGIYIARARAGNRIYSKALFLQK